MKLDKILKLIEAGISPEDIVKLNEVIDDDSLEDGQAADVTGSENNQQQMETEPEEKSENDEAEDNEAEQPKSDEYKEKYEQLLKETQKKARSEDITDKIPKPQSDEDIINELTRSFMT